MAGDIVDQASSTQCETLANAVKYTILQTNNVLDDLKSRFQNVLLAQEQVKHDQSALISEQDRILEDLKVKIVALEDQVLPKDRVAELNNRLVDDSEQLARNLNLRVEGIPVFRNDSPQTILKYIRREMQRLKIEIGEDKYFTAYRIGEAYGKGGTKHQSVMLVMSCSVARTQIYINRNNLKFEVNIDLTSSREALFQFANYQITESINPTARRVAESVYPDLDGRLHLKAKTGKLYGFSTKEEFLALISWLDRQENFR